MQAADLISPSRYNSVIGLQGELSPFGYIIDDISNKQHPFGLRSSSGAEKFE